MMMTDAQNSLDFSRFYWHQRWEIEPGRFTPGRNDVAAMLDAVEFPKRLDGMRVLDIGAWNGCFSFECERRGAADVLAIGPEPAECTGLAVLRDYLGSRVRYQLGSVYDLDPQRVGRFDIVLFFGVFYHLRHPLLGLDNIRRVCGQTLYFESELLPDHGAAPIMQFFARDELSGDYSNWFSPNVVAVGQMLFSAGFSQAFLRPYGPTRIVAKASVCTPEYLQIPCGENVYYDTITKPVLGPREQF
jgi:tRNA (mo5U34)-methyltransferase